MSTIPLTVRGVCPHDCPDTCGFVTTVVDGKVVDFRGDKQHPFTKGFLCRKVAGYLDRTYHKDRLQFPMKRIGPKGKGQFERISWDEAIRTIADKFQAIRDVDPQSILPFSYAGTMGKLQCDSPNRFFNRIGASLLDRTICATAGGVGCDMTLGTRAVVDSESVVHSKYIINWGSNTAVTNSHLWAVMIQARKRGAKIVTIDPYKSPTAARSDWWLPIRPGSDGALALGMMHILFREGWTDEDYLAMHCLGTEQLRERVKEYPVERVAKITGLAIEDIETLTREYATTPPALIRLNYGLQRHGGGGMAVRNICCLPAIVGSWKQVGGGALLSTSKLAPFNNNALQRPDLVPPGTRTINMVNLAEALHGELPGPPVKALFVYNCNPAAICPDQSRVLSGLMREDLFTVVHEIFPTDTVDYADIVLPATTQLEQFDIHGAYGHLYVQANNPAIEPLFEAKPNTEVFRLLAKAMNLEPELFDVSDEALAQQALVAIDMPHGYPKRSAFDGVTLERMMEGPVRLSVPRDYLPFAEGNFGTPSGKCEFFSSRLQAMGFDPLPTYIPPHEDPLGNPDLAAKFPLQMLCPPEPTFLNSSFVNQHKADVGEPRAEIHEDDARPRGIRDGDRISLFNGRGRFQAKAQVNRNVRPGVVMAFGVWWNKYTADAANCNTTTSTAITDLGGGATFFDNLVQVERV